MNRTVEVFGVSNENIESYIEREEVDQKFLEGLERNKHIIVFGSSKQGKTALTNKHLSESDFVRVNCAPQSTPLDIYRSILRQLEVQFVEKTTTGKRSEVSGSASFFAKVKIPFWGEGGGKAEVASAVEDHRKVEWRQVDYNLSLPQDISEILMKYKLEKRIILENFHYLAEEVQHELAFHLRVFEDYGILFIILGIWREKNRLAQFNGDLQDRIIEIPVEPWSRADFKKVASKGGALLKVDFAVVLDRIIENSFDSIGVFQELCKECCMAAEVFATAAEVIAIRDHHLKGAIEKKLEDYSGRHIRSIETFVEQKIKNVEEVPLYIPLHFIKYLLTQTQAAIEAGMKRNQIHEGIKGIHHRPDDVRASDMSYFLHKLTEAQVKKRILPPLFDYDRSTKKLKIIDSTLYFFLRNTDMGELWESLDKPIDVK